MSAENEPLIPVFMPPLVSLLAQQEREKGSPLTEEEVATIRDRGVCIMVRESIANQMAEERGYDDINPQFAWQEWQVVREDLSS